jgi:hypothetical protein
MLCIAESLDRLRGKVGRYKKKQSFTVIAKSMGIQSHTLHAFMRGDDIGLRSIRAIEAWVSQQETTSCQP